MFKKSQHLLFSLGLILILSANFDKAVAQTYRYGAYGLFPQGSSRVMAMGGASSALSRDATGVTFNPAGMALGNWTVDLGGSFNRVTNKEAKSLGTSDDVSKPYDVIFYGGAVRWGPTAFGVGGSSPYNLKTEQIGQKSELSIFSGDAAFAVAFGKVLALGVSAHQEIMKQKYETTNSTTAEGKHFHVKGGFALVHKKMYFGATYTPERQFDIDETQKNTEAGGSTNYFKDVVIPAKWTAGFAVQLKEKVILAVDLDHFYPVKDAVYVGTGTFSMGSEILIDDKEQDVLHGGVEWQIIDTNSHAVALRGGFYNEPARLVGGSTRGHITFGIEVRFGPAVLGVAYDQATNFTNTSQGFSLSFGSI